MIDRLLILELLVTGVHYSEMNRFCSKALNFFSIKSIERKSSKNVCSVKATRDNIAALEFQCLHSLVI